MLECRASRFVVIVGQKLATLVLQAWFFQDSPAGGQVARDATCQAIDHFPS